MKFHFTDRHNTKNGVRAISRYSRTRDKVRHYTTEGRRPVLEALRAGKRFQCIYVSEDSLLSPRLREAVKQARFSGVKVEVVSRKEIEARSATKKSQGILAVAHDERYSTLDDLVSELKAGRQLLLCVLDGVQDPHNLGAVARTLEAVGGHGMIIKKDKAVGITPGALRSSAGALEHVKVSQEKSIPQALKALRAQGIRTIGLDEKSDRSFYEADYSRSLAVVMGNEHRGLSQATRDECDEVVSLPLYGKIGSLNVAVAAGVVLYEALRRRERGE